MSNTDEIKEINDILGYGQELRVLVGVKEDGQKDIKSFHFTPVSLAEIPILMGKLDKFFVNTDFTKWNDNDKNNAAEIVLTSLKRMHPDMTIEYVKEHFGLGIMARAIKIVMDVNDFLSEVQAMNQSIETATKGLTPVKN